MVGTRWSVASSARRAQRVRVVALTVGLALLWPLLWSFAGGSSDSLLGAGVSGPSRAAVDQEIPDLHHVAGIGHDGQQFYVIARHPFDPPAAARSLDEPTYRYRRILFPLLAGAMAPHGGRGLIAAFAALSLFGVALGAWALSGLDGAPRWLPLSLAVMPVVITSLTLSLSDALATGLALAGVLAVQRRRWAVALAALTLAVLTRETFVLVALGLAWAPGMPRRWRLGLVAGPATVLAAWSLWCAHRLHAPVIGGSAAQLALPFAGWLSRNVQPASLGLGLITGAVLGAGAWRARRSAPHFAVVLTLQLLLLVCLSDLVTFTWMNSLRTAGAMVPLAIWSLVRAGRAPASALAPTPGSDEHALLAASA
ncbi:MAG: rane protein of unknown function [Acidimicrobiales bacterium]|nr:rane protein of unknown function [Acidimicrobiales bacterium]